MKTLMEAMAYFGEPEQNETLGDESVLNTVLWAISSLKRA
jgi:hypothetical protein